MLEDIFNEMKTKNIEAVLVRRDGYLIQSTFAVDEMLPSLLASAGNTSDAIMREIKDSGKECEIAFDDQFLVIIALGNYLLCGLVKDREQKKDIRSYAEKIEQSLGQSNHQ